MSARWAVVMAIAACVMAPTTDAGLVRCSLAEKEKLIGSLVEPKMDALCTGGRPRIIVWSM